MGRIRTIRTIRVQKQGERMKKMKKIVGTLMLLTGFLMFMFLGAVDDFDMNPLKFLLIWLSLLAVSGILIHYGYKLTGIKE